MMKLMQCILVSMAVCCAFVVPTATLAHPSATFYEKDGDVFDEWDVCRTRLWGEDGYFEVVETRSHKVSFRRPTIVYESLGENADRAYQLGQKLAQDYPDRHQRAEKVFAVARDRIRYKPDVDEFGFDEYAQNADEVAATISSKGFAYGDCEDHAILLAVMYKAAGFRSAIVLVKNPEEEGGHAATLVCLPSYRRANIMIPFQGEPGWVWAEATGGNNPLGWMPEQYMGKWEWMLAREITE